MIPLESLRSCAKKVSGYGEIVATCLYDSMKTATHPILDERPDALDALRVGS